MTLIGAFEAKTHLSQLLDRVEAGEEIAITRHGATVAKLVPVANTNRAAAREAVAGIKQLRQELARRGVRIERKEIRSWIEEGRR